MPLLKKHCKYNKIKKKIRKPSTKIKVCLHKATNQINIKKLTNSIIRQILLDKSRNNYQIIFPPSQCNKRKKRRTPRRCIKCPKPTCPPIKLYSHKESNLITTNTWSSCIPQDMSKCQNMTYLIINHGPNPVTFNVELSPDKRVWVEDNSQEYTLEPNAYYVYVPNVFLKWIKVAYRSGIIDQPTRLTIYYQAQIYV